MKARPTATVVMAAVAVILVAAFAWSIKAFSRYQPYDFIPGAMASPPLNVGLSLQDVELQGRDHGMRLWTFHAASIALSRDRTSATADQLDDGILYQNAHPMARFAAGHADADLGPFGPATGKLTLSGMVRLQSVGAATKRMGGALAVATPRIVWDSAHGIVTCPCAVKANLASLGSLTARKLTYDTRAKMLSFGHVQVVAAAESIAPLPPVATDDTQPASSSAQAASDAKKTPAKSDVVIDAPEGGQVDEQTHIVSLRGPVKFTQGDATMETVGGTYNDSSGFARSEAPVTIQDPEMTLVGSEGTVDFKRHVATLHGDIKLTVKPKASTAKGTDNLDTEARQPSTMTCDEIVYNYRTKQADATGHFVIHQKDRTVTADMGHYDAPAKLVTLKGPVVYTTSDGQSFTTPQQAVVSLAPGHETVDVTGPIHGNFPVNDQDNPLPTDNAASNNNPSPKNNPPPSH